jgi:hypothetical protein
MASEPREDQRSQEPAAPPPISCPWCPYTGSLKQVLLHMEAAHPQRWQDLALYPPIVGGEPI